MCLAVSRDLHQLQQEIEMVLLSIAAHEKRIGAEAGMFIGSPKLIVKVLKSVDSCKRRGAVRRKVASIKTQLDSLVEKHNRLASIVKQSLITQTPHKVEDLPWQLSSCMCH